MTAVCEHGLLKAMIEMLLSTRSVSMATWRRVPTPKSSVKCGPSPFTRKKGPGTSITSRSSPKVIEVQHWGKETWHSFLTPFSRDFLAAPPMGFVAYAGWDPRHRYEETPLHPELGQHVYAALRLLGGLDDDDDEDYVASAIPASSEPPTPMPLHKKYRTSRLSRRQEREQVVRWAVLVWLLLFSLAAAYDVKWRVVGSAVAEDWVVETGVGVGDEGFEALGCLRFMKRNLACYIIFVASFTLICLFRLPLLWGCHGSHTLVVRRWFACLWAWEKEGVLLRNHLRDEPSIFNFSFPVKLLHCHYSKIPCRVNSVLHEWCNDFPNVSYRLRRRPGSGIPARPHWLIVGLQQGSGGSKPPPRSLRPHWLLQEGNSSDLLGSFFSYSCAFGRVKAQGPKRPHLLSASAPPYRLGASPIPAPFLLLSFPTIKKASLPRRLLDGPDSYRFFFLSQFLPFVLLSSAVPHQRNGSPPAYGSSLPRAIPRHLSAPAGLLTLFCDLFSHFSVLPPPRRFGLIGHPPAAASSTASLEELQSEERSSRRPSSAALQLASPSSGPPTNALAPRSDSLTTQATSATPFHSTPASDLGSWRDRILDNLSRLKALPTDYTHKFPGQDPTYDMLISFLLDKTVPGEPEGYLRQVLASLPQPPLHVHHRFVRDLPRSVLPPICPPLNSASVLPYPPFLKIFSLTLPETPGQLTPAIATSSTTSTRSPALPRIAKPYPAASLSMANLPFHSPTARQQRPQQPASVRETAFQQSTAGWCLPVLWRRRPTAAPSAFYRPPDNSSESANVFATNSLFLTSDQQSGPWQTVNFVALQQPQHCCFQRSPPGPSRPPQQPEVGVACFFCTATTHTLANCPGFAEAKCLDPLATPAVLPATLRAVVPRSAGATSTWRPPPTTTLNSRATFIIEDPPLVVVPSGDHD
ncbi:hypothetical protein Efla_000522 [Eimeria flavescens]